MRFFDQINYFIALSILFLSCNVDYGVTLPDEIPIGTNIIYINGEQRNFENYFYSVKTVDNKLRFFIKFTENVNDGEFINQLGSLTYWPASNTEYVLMAEESEETMTMQVAFTQIYDEDLPGWDYKFTNSNDNYFFIEKLDTLNNTVSGRGLLKFKRTKTNGVSGGAGLDASIECEFKFNDYFEEK